MFQCDPQKPVKIVRDEIDECKINEAEMGMLSTPAAAQKEVKVMHPGLEVSSECRWLATYSKFFRRHLARYPTPSVVRVPENLPVEGFAGVMEFLENGEVDVSAVNLGPLLCVATRLEIPQLQRRLEQYLRVLSFRDGSYFLACWDICHRAPATVQLRDEMMRRGTETFGTLYGLPEWPRLNDHLIRQLFMRPDLKSKSPVNVYEAALSWLAGNSSAEPQSADRIMSAVPFYRMSTIDRMQCLHKAKQLQIVSLVKPRIMLADWHVSCHDAHMETASDLRPPIYDLVFGEKRIEPITPKGKPIPDEERFRFDYSQFADEADRPKPGEKLGFKSDAELKEMEAKKAEEKRQKPKAQSPKSEGTRIPEKKAEEAEESPKEEAEESRVPVATAEFETPSRFVMASWMRKAHGQPRSSSAPPTRTESEESRTMPEYRPPAPVAVISEEKAKRQPLDPFFGRPISFKSYTFARKLLREPTPQISSSTSVTKGPFGKPLRYTSHIWAKKYRDGLGAESVSQKKPNSMPSLKMDSYGARSKSSPSEIAPVAVADSASSGSVYDGGKPIRFTTRTEIHKIINGRPVMYSDETVTHGDNVIVANL